MRGLHPYSIMIGFAIGIASFLALRLGPFAAVVGIVATIAINEGIKRRALLDMRKREERFDDDR